MAKNEKATQDEVTHETKSQSSPLTNGFKGVAEVLLPGSSLLMDGDIKKGAIHTVGGLAGRVVLGPVGWFAAAANSYSNSVTGKNLHEHFIKQEDAKQDSIQQQG